MVVLMLCVQYFRDDAAELVVCPVFVLLPADVGLHQLCGQSFSRQQRIHPKINRITAHQVPYVALPGLGNPVNPVLGLKIVVQTEGPVIKHGMVRHRQGQPFLCSARSRYQYPHAFIPFES